MKFRVKYWIEVIHIEDAVVEADSAEDVTILPIPMEIQAKYEEPESWGICERPVGPEGRDGFEPDIEEVTR
jgi:hypothetical protein